MVTRASRVEDEVKETRDRLKDGIIEILRSEGYTVEKGAAADPVYARRRPVCGTCWGSGWMLDESRYPKQFVKIRCTVCDGDGNP